jgi:hypothetical protein
MLMLISVSAACRALEREFADADARRCAPPAAADAFRHSELLPALLKMKVFR